MQKTRQLKTSPFTIHEAQELATSFQHLVGREYVDEKTKLLYKIRAVGVLPFFPYDKCTITHMCMGLMFKTEGFSLSAIFDFIEANNIHEYDVVFTASPSVNNCKLLIVQPIDTVVTANGLEYTFNVSLL